jgi:diacylglycerol kinase (ATP)
MKITLIYNPNAGSDKQPSGDELRALIEAAGHTVVHHISDDRNWDTTLNDPVDLVVVAGGDGTVGEVAKMLIGKAPAIAVLPMGTANNIAATLGIMNRPLEELIAEWASARRVQFDVGEAKGPWGSMCFIEGFGIGLFTETMSRLHATDSLAHLDDTQIKITSVLHILKERLRNYPAKNLKVTLDGREISGPYILLEALNTKYIGPNLHLAPEADPSDGLLDIAFVSEAEKDQLGKYLSDSTAPKLFQPGWTIRQGQYLQIQWDGFPVHIDDKLWPEKDSSVPLSPAIIEVKANCFNLAFLAPG